MPRWSPDGGHLVFVRREASGDAVVVQPVGGLSAREVATSPESISVPAWSPVDADRILVVIDHKSLAVLSVATGELEYLTDYDDSTLIADCPSWSSDASKAYFSLTRKVGDLILIESGRGVEENSPVD